jgi:hypothetical protein
MAICCQTGQEAANVNMFSVDHFHGIVTLRQTAVMDKGNRLKRSGAWARPLERVCMHRPPAVALTRVAIMRSSSVVFATVDMAKGSVAKVFVS